MKSELLEAYALKKLTEKLAGPLAAVLNEDRRKPSGNAWINRPITVGGTFVEVGKIVGDEIAEKERAERVAEVFVQRRAKYIKLLDKLLADNRWTDLRVDRRHPLIEQNSGRFRRRQGYQDRRP